MKRAGVVLAVVAMSAALVYLAYVLPSQMLGDTMSHQTVTPSHTMTEQGTPLQDEVTPLARHGVTVEVLEVRSGAGEMFQNVGYLRHGETVTVYEVQTVTGETCRQWARIDADKWTCYEMLEVTP